MNKTFKIVYNRARQGLMVANEITSSVQKKGAKTVVAIAAAALCGAAFAESEGGGVADSTVTFNEDTTISTSDSSGEAASSGSSYDGRYSGIAATGEGKTTEVTVVEGATLNIEGDLDNMSNAERIYLISAQTGSKVTITGDVTGTIKTTDGRNIRGIRANGGEISINGNLNVIVNGGTAEAQGLDAWEKAKVTLEGEKTTLNVTSSGTSGKGTYGFDAEEGSTVSFLATETEISVDNSKGNGTYSRGAYAYQSTTRFTGNTTIKVLGNNALTEGIHFECDPGNSYETNVSFSGDETTIDVSGKGESYAIYASGVPGTISFIGKTATIKSHSSEGVACGIRSQYGAHANFTADTSVTVSTESSGYARGIWIANYGGKDAYVAGNAEFKNLTVTVDAKNADAYGIYNEASKVNAPKSGETDGTFKAESTTLTVSAAGKALGIYADGDLAKVTVGTLEKFEVSSTSGDAYGVVSQNSATVNLGTSNDASVIIVSSSGKDSRAIDVSAGGTVNLGTTGDSGTKLKSVTLTVDDSARYVALLDGSNTALNVNAGTYTQTGSGHGIRVIKGATLTMNVDEFNSTTAYSAIHTRESASSKAEVTAKTFTATATGNEAGVAVLQVNEGSTLTVKADTATLTGTNKLCGGVLGTGTYGTLTLDTKNLSMAGNINGTYGNVDNKGNEAKFVVKATESLNLAGNINVGSLGSSNELLTDELKKDGAVSSFSRNTTVSVEAGKATIVGDINVWENTSDKTNTSDTNSVTLKLGNGSTITGNISVLGNEGSTSSSATDAKNKVEIQATGTDLTFAGNITATNGGSVTLNGGLYKVNTLTITNGFVTLSKGTLQTSLTEAFGDDAKWTSESLNRVTGLTLASGTTLSLTDGETFTSDFLTKLKSAAGENVVLSFVNAKLKLGDEEKATLIDDVIQETTTITVTTTTTEGGKNTATIGNSVIKDADETGASTTGAQTIELDKAAAVTVAESINLTLVGKTDGSSFIENATAVTVANNATLNLGSVNATEATSGSLPAVTLNENATLNVENTTVSTTALIGGTGVTINVGSSDSAGVLHTEKLTLNGGLIFIDPAWQDGTTIADASFMSVGEVSTSNLNGSIVAGQNSVLALGADKATAIAGFNALAQNNSDLTWAQTGDSAITAALYIGQPITLTNDTKILVDGDKTTAPSAADLATGVEIKSQGLLMVDQVAVADSAAITGTLKLNSGSYIGLVNATGGTLTLATTMATDTATSGVTVVTDNPFVTAQLSSNTITSTFNSATGLQALASTGMQAMTRRADSILAQTIADRTSVDQELAAGANLWVDVAGETYEADKLDNGASFKADMGYGAFGAEFGIGDTATAGAAIQYGKGSLRSSVSSIKNSIDSYGATIYGTMKFGESKVVADIAYLKNTNDITSSQTALNQKPDTQMYSIGVRGQHRFTAGNFQIVPSVGVRVSRLETDSMDIGSVKVKKQKQNIVQVPIALRINGVTQNAAGWAISPSFKVAYVPTFGDKEITALGADQTVIDTSPVQADFGIRAQKGNLLLNANFMAGTGNDGASSIGGKVGLKYVF